MRHPNESEVTDGGEGGGNALRIDRWLWCTRLFKSRSQAADAVAGGKVHVNGRRVKPALAVKVGDRVTITRVGYEFECEVLKLPDRRGSAPIAQACYAETDAARAGREDLLQAFALLPADDARVNGWRRRLAALLN
jgi:ribosome-associated heat shock protein Hsp15